MKLYYKRILFFALLIMSTVGFVGVTAVLVYEIVGKRTVVYETSALKILFDLMCLVVVYFFGKYDSDRKKAGRFFQENRLLLHQTLLALSDEPILCVASKRKRGKAAGALVVDGCYVLPEAAAPEKAIHNAAAAATKLYAGLKQREDATYSDYSENTLQFCLRRKRPCVWTVRVNSSGLRYTLFFSPDGKTQALNEIAFFPPKKLADGWFV